MCGPPPRRAIRIQYYNRARLTSVMSGSTRRLSVTRVTVVSVKVDLVMVSVTRPGAEGGGGSSAGAGAGRCTVTRTPRSTGDAGRAARAVPRKCAGIIAWNSSLVSGLAGCANDTFTSRSHLRPGPARALGDRAEYRNLRDLEIRALYFEALRTGYPGRSRRAGGRREFVRFVSARRCDC